MFKVELTIQEFERGAGAEGMTAWPLSLTEDQLGKILSLQGTLVLNTRMADQVVGTTLWAIPCPLLLVTVLQSWERKQDWVTPILEIFAAEDKHLNRSWALRLVEGSDGWLEEEVPLDAILGRDFILAAAPVPDRKAHRRYLRGLYLLPLREEEEEKPELPTVEEYEDPSVPFGTFIG